MAVIREARPTFKHSERMAIQYRQALVQAAVAGAAAKTLYSAARDRWSAGVSQLMEFRRVHSFVLVHVILESSKQHGGRSVTSATGGHKANHS